MAFLQNFFTWFRGGGFPTGTISDHSGQQLKTPSAPLFNDVQPATLEQGMQISAVWSCVTLLSETIASLPLAVYEVDKEGNKSEARDSRLWQVLHQPNAIMTAHDFWVAMGLNRFLRGNAYALISRDKEGNLISLVPLAADQMTVGLVDGELAYQYYKDGEYTFFKPSQILHWKGLGNGIVGFSTFDYMRYSATELVNAQKNATMMFGNGNQLTGILSIDKVLNPEQMKDLRDRFKRIGDANVDSWLKFLPADMKFQQVAMSAADAQLLESRQFGVEEIGRWFGVPSALLNSDGGNNEAAEASVETFYRSTIQPLCIALEQAIFQRVFSLQEQIRYVAEFKMNGLLRANVASRYSSYAQALQNGFMTRNEVRKMENLPVVDGADQLTAQSNLFPVQDLGKQSQKQPQTPLSDQPVGQ